MKNAIPLFLKGLAMGAANVIPGVSGGTIALVTGIFERLISAIKSFDLSVLRLVLKGHIKEAWAKIDGNFLLAIFSGVGLSIISLAYLFKIWIEHPVHGIWLMAFFFGLIIVSIFQVGRTVLHWNVPTIVALVVGFAIAGGIALLTPASENESIWYLLVCGVVAMCSMILPGLSGSFVLILMGNYKLIMLEAVSEFRFDILIPVVIGAVGGLIAFSRVLAWIFDHYRDTTISLLTGFIAGSLAIIWPWKRELHLLDPNGEEILKNGKPLVSGFDWYLPDMGDPQVWIAVGFMAIGALVIWAVEHFADSKKEKVAQVKA